MREAGWMMFAAACTVFGVVEGIGILVAVRQHDWFLAATTPLFVLGAYWFAAGAWFRTARGRAVMPAAPPDPPALSPLWARRYVVMSAACAVASATALAYQWISTR